MRFSGGHDYYDTALGLGRDETLFFERTAADSATVVKHEDSGFARQTPSYLEFQGKNRFCRDETFAVGDVTFGFVPLVVYFAGVRHAGVHMQATLPSHKVADEQFFWSKASLFEFLDKHGVKLYETKRSRGEGVTAHSIHTFFEAPVAKSELDWMIENRVSIAISNNSFNWHSWRFWSRDPGWTINSDGLNKIGFAKCLHPYEAFQRLSQWVGGVLAGEGRPMVKITDEKVVLKKHGFDKRSFKHRV